MSLHVSRWRRQQTASPNHASCAVSRTSVKRIVVFTVILLVVIVLVAGGQPVCDAAGLVMAAGAAAAQIDAWLNDGQTLAAGSPGGV